jgi:hypothetical protein
MSTIDPLSGTSPLGTASQSTSPGPASDSDVQQFSQAMARGGTASAPNTDASDWAAFWSALPTMIVLQGMNHQKEYRDQIREIDGG